MNIFDHYRQRYEAAKDEEFTLQEFLTTCRQDRSAYANAAERLLMAIGEPVMVDTAQEPRLSRLFSNRVIARYPAFEEFYGMEDAIEQIVSYLKHAAQGLEEKKQILYLLGPVGGGKSSLAERLKSLMQLVPIYVLSANGERSPVNDRSEYSVQNADCRPLARGGKTDWCGYSHHAWCGRTRLMSGTLLAFDFGTKSIGVAVGQRITGTARPLPAIKAQDGTPDWNIIERLLKEWQPDEIIVGLPLNMDGTEQPLTARARKFANRIHGRFGVEVKLHDERLSTVEARSGLFEQGGYRALNKGKVDSASAVIILESYFEQGY